MGILGITIASMIIIVMLLIGFYSVTMIIDEVKKK